MQNLEFVVPAERREKARSDAAFFLSSATTSSYAVANDIPLMDVVKVDIEEINAALPKIDRTMKVLQRIKELKTSTDNAAARAELLVLVAEVQKISQMETPPTSELAKKIREIRNYAKEITGIKDELELALKMYPHDKALLEQLTASNNKKEARKRELEGERLSLTRKSGNATYAAIVLQIFGLMLILGKDLAKKT
jgi:hypothetical protein